MTVRRRADDIDIVAKALCDSEAPLDPDEALQAWDDLNEDGREYYRKRIKDILLQEEALRRLLHDRTRDDGAPTPIS